ncbi:hypothetical protein BUALT_BualtUnG0010600 [Buddleja alternifolia]|uniref:NAD-dependent epimerase/dehydratase domain-containing protein n=1 Tax=Buddleja alternifolia TaxID=168488 RepID=A0AAV6W6U4_9LAMI|nr:hypothetical protein BUALT_BualtUnG0010600 [Buddleja alternifolia]
MAKEVSNGGNNVTTKPPPEPSPLRRAKFFKANMRILVTGGAGFIGSHLVDKLMENEKNEVIVVDNYFTGSKDNIRQWIGHPRLSLSVTTIKTNVIGTLNMLGLAKRVAQEIRIARIFNTYGPRMNIDDGRVVSNFLAQAIRDEPLTVQLPGTQTRSFCYVADMVDGLIRLMEGDNTGQSTWQSSEFTMLELAETVKEFAVESESFSVTGPKGAALMDTDAMQCPG